MSHIRFDASPTTCHAPELTITWHSRERDIHVDSQLLPSALIDNNGRLDFQLTIVDEFDESEQSDDRKGQKSEESAGLGPDLGFF